MLRPPARLGDLEVGELLIRRHVLVHIDARDKDAAEHKGEMLVFMLQKLYALAAGRVREDNPDSLVSQEVLLPGHLWGVILKEKLGEWLESVHTLVTKELRYGKGAQERRGAAPRRRRVAAGLPRVLRQAQGRRRGQEAHVLPGDGQPRAARSRCSSKPSSRHGSRVFR